jgi:hypothetical protein
MLQGFLGAQYHTTSYHIIAFIKHGRLSGGDSFDGFIKIDPNAISFRM